MRILALIIAALGMLSSPVLAAGEPGTLSVSSSVAGAEVYIDFELAGTTPLVKKMEAGTYNIRVTADNYDPWVMRVDLKAGQPSSLMAKLLRGGGTVEFLIEPAGSAVLLDGKPVGKTPIRITAVTEGDHEWTVQSPLFESSEGRFTFRKGQNVLVVGELQSSRGLFSITSKPKGATVFMDGKEVGVTPLELEGIEPGIHRIRYQVDKGPIVLREVDTSDGTKGEVSANIPKRSARLLVGTGDEFGRVFLNDQLVGEGRRVFLRLARGQYTLRVEADSSKSAERKLRVPAGGVLAFRANLVPEEASMASRIEEGWSVNSPWILWTAAGVGGVGAVTGVAVIARNAGGSDNEPPEPQPDSGDLVVRLP